MINVCFEPLKATIPVQSILLTITALVLVTLLPTQSTAETRMDVVVDATDLPRKLLTSEISLALPDDTTSLLYPKWIPGYHAPDGPVENLCGFEVTAADGKVLTWERDWQEVYRLNVFSDESSRQGRVSLCFICNQSYATYGWSSFGIIDWNTVVVYPEGPAAYEITVTLSLVLPSDWKFGSALPVESHSGDTVHFQPVTLEELVDAPLICGRYLRTVPVAQTANADYYLHMVADDAETVAADDSTLAAVGRLVREAEALFTRTHFDEYHFLLVVDDETGSLGIEHRNSSLNIVDNEGLEETNWTHSTVPLLAHELTHAWNGKYRRPVGMATPDYQEPKNMDMLWVYEGLTDYLDMVLSARCGVWEPDEFGGRIARNMNEMIKKKGRRWRSLRDTQVATQLAWNAGPSWSLLSRDADYYKEGGLLWLETDARIRQASNGEKSLDDFCASFYGEGDVRIRTITYDFDALVAALSELAATNWDSLYSARLNHPQEDFNCEVAEWCGHRLSFVEEKPNTLKIREERREYRSFDESIGILVDDSGCITEVGPGSPADLAGLCDGEWIRAVESKAYSHDRLEAAIRRSQETMVVPLLIRRDETFREVIIAYDQGLKYSKLIPIDGSRDWLKEIVRSKATTK